MTSANLVHTIYTNNYHKYGHIALGDPGIYSKEHRDMPQFGSASFLLLQASVPSVSFPVNNVHSSAHVLPQRRLAAVTPIVTSVQCFNAEIFL